MKRTSLLLFLVLSLLGINVHSQTTVVESKGTYAEIDTTLIFEMIDVFGQGSASEKQKAIAEIKAHPEEYAPPIFYLLSQALFENNKEDAMFWFYAGQLRARYDANRCADESAAAAVNVLNYEFGPPIHQYALQHVDQLKKIIPDVVQWDEKTTHEYDHRWINLHGMGAYTSKGRNVVLSKPKKDWGTIAKKTRDEFLAGFDIPPQRELNETEKKFIGKWAGSRADMQWEIHRKADRTFEIVFIEPDPDRFQKMFKYYAIGIWWVDGKDYMFEWTHWWGDEGDFSGLLTEIVDVAEEDRVVTLSDDEEDPKNIEVRVEAFKLKAWTLKPAKWNGEQDGTDLSATASESKAESQEKSQPQKEPISQ